MVVGLWVVWCFVEWCGGENVVYDEWMYHLKARLEPDESMLIRFKW